MWYRRSIREELKEKILDKIPSSMKREYDIEKYVQEYVSSLKLGVVKPGNERLIDKGIEDIYKKIREDNKK
ncbi:hypothetical protein A3K64_03085 [Candidatus Micrarchaeota archaeon RBG_16_36_9]|nr:MAG: hypothetical protein A3K64_03085 [Candidatus Micrarchaeota archaeon RBG_16_36_9]